MIDLTRLLEAKQIARSVQYFDVEGVKAEIMALTSELIDELLEVVDYGKALDLAANMGIAFNGRRVYEDDDQLFDLEEIWEGDIPESDPAIRHLIGVKVCEISGIIDPINKKKPTLMSGDEITDEEYQTDIHKLAQDRAHGIGA